MLQRIQDRKREFCLGNNFTQGFFASLVFVEVFVSLVIDLGNKFSQVSVVCFSYYLPTDILDQPVAFVAPTSQFAYCFQILGDRTPSLFACLEAITLVQVLACLNNEPPSNGTAVIGALHPWFRQWWDVGHN